MKRQLQLLVMLLVAWVAWTGGDGSLDKKQRAWAQSPGSSSKSDNGSRDDRRGRDRGRFGDRGSRDWRSSGRSRSEDERRGDENRGEERSGSSSTPSTNSSTTSNSSRATGSTTSTPSASSATSGAASSVNLQSWATSLVKQHDKNGNMILEPDEQGFLGTSAAGEDLNHDGKITIDELVMHHSAGSSVVTTAASTSDSSAAAKDSGQSGDRERDRERFGRFGYGRRDGDSSSGSNAKADSDPLSKRVLTGSAGGTAATTKEGDKRHSYRFSRPDDKLPTGLPSWFKSRDTNGDGQVSMSEYSRSVSESMVAEFRRYDLNDDGIITAKEAAKQK